MIFLWAVITKYMREGSKTPTVLLVYLAESHQHYQLIGRLVTYLRDHCYINVITVDDHCGTQVSGVSDVIF